MAGVKAPVYLAAGVDRENGDDGGEFDSAPESKEPVYVATATQPSARTLDPMGGTNR